MHRFRLVVKLKLHCIRKLHVLPTIQFSILDEAARAHPNTWWWIKADGADLVSGLGESVKGVWSGDVDLADGELRKAQMLHQERIDFHDQLVKRDHRDPLKTAEDITVVEQQTIQDVVFISTSELHAYFEELVRFNAMISKCVICRHLNVNYL